MELEVGELEVEEGELEELERIDDNALASCCRFCSASCSRNNFCLALKESTVLGLMSAREGVLGERVVGVVEKGRSSPAARVVGRMVTRRACRDSILLSAVVFW